MGLGRATQDIAEISLALKRSGVAPNAIIITQAHDMASFQPGDPRPPGPDYSEMAVAARAAFPGIPIGGGVVAFFTELNRLPVPIGLFDFVVHTVCPAVHAADDQTLMENLEAAKWIFASTRQMIGATKYQLGPSWISSRVNPYERRPSQIPQMNVFVLLKKTQGNSAFLARRGCWGLPQLRRKRVSAQSAWLQYPALKG
jgi:hypothetical protein